MTARDSGPETGDDGTDDEYPPMMDATDFQIAMALEGRKQDARVAVNDACGALLNDDQPLTDQKVADLYDAGEALTGLADALVHRIPREERGPVSEAHRSEEGDQSQDQS